MLDDSQAELPTLVGMTVGSYRIVERLGAGGMGEVYVGEHVRIVRRVAVKFLLPEMTGDRGMVDRFFAEARATSSIRHPGIVEIFDCDVDAGGRAYIVMELLSGESLAARLKRDERFGLDVARPLVVAQQMASALSAAHASGIIHRDLKPDNVFVSEGEGTSPQSLVVKILDFGIAKLLVGTEAMRSDRVSITIPGTVLGSPSYMSPEQCRDASNVDHRTDLYSLGCILFEMLCGRPPFVAENFAELVAALLQRHPPSVGQLRAGTPLGVQSLVQRLLAKSPEDRPASMDEVGAEIAALRAELSKTEPASSASLLRPPVAARWYLRVPGVALLLAALLTVGGGVAITLAHRIRSQPRLPSAASSPPPQVLLPARPSTAAASSSPPRAAQSTPRSSVAAPTSPTSPISPIWPTSSTPTNDRGLMTPARSQAAAPRNSAPAPQRRPQRPPALPSLSNDARKL